MSDHPSGVSSSSSHPRYAPGSEPPGAYGPDPGTVRRTFAFVDICRFTEYAQKHGNRQAVDLLAGFRATIRSVAERRGVRVAKWLGDGAMLVGVNTAPVIATVVELVITSGDLGIDIRAGIATGEALLAEGDDYIGSPVNLAARLCDAAGRGVVIADRTTSLLAPDWVHVGDSRTLRIKGFGRMSGMHLLAPDSSHLPHLN